MADKYKNTLLPRKGITTTKSNVSDVSIDYMTKKHVYSKVKSFGGYGLSNRFGKRSENYLSLVEQWEIFLLFLEPFYNEKVQMLKSSCQV